MDRQDLAKMCDARDIVKMMHIPYQNNQNGTLKILCLGHEERLGKKDTHIGNCVVYKTGYKCYACQTFVKTKDGGRGNRRIPAGL
jgi:hypothetical protein